jgi:flagellar biosynthesis protein FlhG
MHDQADRLRELVRRSVAAHPALAPGAPLVAISGGRPGDGATVLACQLGRELARLGKRVVLVDADLAGPHLTARMAPRLRRPARGSLADVARGTRRAVEALCVLDDGLQLLAGSPAGEAAAWDAAAVQRVLQEIPNVGVTADLVLVDLGAGMSPWVDQFWQIAAEVLLVCRHDPASVQDAYRALKLSTWERLQRRMRVVVEGDGDSQQIAAIGQRLAETCREFLALEIRGCSGITTRGRAAWGKSASLLVDDPQFVRSVRLLAADMLCDDGLQGLRRAAAS